MNTASQTGTNNLPDHDFFFFFCLFVPRTITLFGLEFKEESRKMVSVVQSSSHVKRCELFLALRE